MVIEHKERAHSKYSASGSIRWLSCAASVELEEASPPSKDNVWSTAGTHDHEGLEALVTRRPWPAHVQATEDRLARVHKARAKIQAVHKVFGGVLLVEKRVYATFVHPEMFGTVDIIIAPTKPYLGVRTLHIMDYKGGEGIVDPEGNTQLIQYALSVAESYGWELAYDEVKLWILQPKAGKNWSPSWTVPMKELRTKWLSLWEKGVARVERGNNKPFPGSWCHWCRAKLTCPAKVGVRQEKYNDLFLNNPLKGNGNEYEKQGRPQGQQSEKEKSHGKQAGQKVARQKSKGRESKEESSEESFY